MRRFRIGLRTLKTALAVTVSLLIASLLGDLSIFPALSAFAVMARTFEEGLQECRNQAVGIAIGGISINIAKIKQITRFIRGSFLILKYI